MRSVGTLGDRVLCKLVRIPRFQPASFVWTSHSPAGLGGPQGEGRGVSEASGVVPAFYTPLQILETKATPPLQERSGLPGKAAPTLLRRRLHNPPHPPHPIPHCPAWGRRGPALIYRCSPIALLAGLFLGLLCSGWASYLQTSIPS